MARTGMILDVSGDMPDLELAVRRFPRLKFRFLSGIGMKAARALYYERLDMTLHPRSFSSTGAPLSKTGRRMASYSAPKSGSAVIIRSYPLNVLRRGPGPRTAKRTLGGQIFRSFKSGFNANAIAAGVLDRTVSGKGGLLDTGGSPEWLTRLMKTKGGSRGNEI